MILYHVEEQIRRDNLVEVSIININYNKPADVYVIPYSHKCVC